MPLGLDQKLFAGKAGGQGQMAGLRGLQARFRSSPPERTGIRAPSLMEVEVTVIQEAAFAMGTTAMAAAGLKTAA